jgi:hypothetical protein
MSTNTDQRCPSCFVLTGPDQPAHNPDQCQNVQTYVRMAQGFLKMANAYHQALTANNIPVPRP